MRPLLIPLLVASAILGKAPAFAQAQPFRMLPEEPAAAPASPAPRGTPPAAKPFDMGAPQAQPSSPQPSQLPRTGAGTGSNAPFQMTPQHATPDERTPRALSATPRASQSPVRIERPILPFQTIQLEGETDVRSWAVHLTQDEASSGTTLSVGYQNAVVVMPEASRLRISINGETVIDTPITSPDGIRQVTASIRPGLLHAGQNIIRMQALQRHRTDCAPAATYELWTKVDSASTKLIFAEGATKTLRSLEDLPAVGVDTTGVTTIRVLAPKIYRPEIRDRLLRLVQLVALRGRYAHPVIQVVEADPGPSPVGTIKVVMGLAGELRGLVPKVPDAATTQPLTMMMQDQASGGSTLVVSGPTWQDLDTAIEIIGTSVLGIDSARRNMIDTASWLWPEVPTSTGDQTFRLADLGVPTQEFSGRRLRAHFAISLPPDFYATEYAEAILHLDAAYTSAVKPGSHVDVYVNGNIGTSLVITSRGDVVRRHTIRIPMKNFKSGINFIALDAVLLTDADERCGPGETLSETNRFVLFDSSMLEIPHFGRIGRLPDLGVLSAGSLPYGNLPTNVVLARLDQAHYSAAGTLLARIAQIAGSPMRAMFSNAASADDETVLFVGTVDQIPSPLLENVKVSENLRTLWPATPVRSEGSDRLASAGGSGFSFPAAQGSFNSTLSASTEEIRKRWAETFQRQGLIQQTVGAIKDWVENTFNLSLTSLSLTERANAPYEPPQRATLLVAQGRSRDAGTWTLMTARSGPALAEGMAQLANPFLWTQVSGRAIALDPRDPKLVIEPIRNYRFVQTQPPSFTNLRLVAANWMSANILQYALFLLAFCVLLGLATYLLLRRAGRSS